MERMLNWGVMLAAVLLLGACGGSGSGGASSAAITAPPAATANADITLLVMGNSHASVNGLPGMVVAMIKAGRPGKSVVAVEAPGWMFLEDRLHDTASISLLKSRTWSTVILQAQKYSTSGQFSYSTAEAETLVRMSREQGAVPVMFPEWPRLGVDETARIYDLHVGIARKERACVAPIGQAWDLALQRHPGLVLHDADGNHSAPAGAFLAALVLYATIIGLSPNDLQHFEEFAVDRATQTLLRGIATETVAAFPPREWCPGDPLR